MTNTMNVYFGVPAFPVRQRPTPPPAFEQDLHALLDALGVSPNAGGMGLPRCEAGRNGNVAPRPDLRLVVGAVKDFIDAHAEEDLNLDRIAAAVGLSKFYLVRLFHDVEGRTPWAYVRDARLRKARELLETDLSLAEIALRAGFYDQSHFTRTFSKAEGETPGRYRRRRKIIQDRAPIRP